MATKKMKQVLVSGLALLQILSGDCASNTLTSTPPLMNGNIIACVGDEISLTCSHDDVGSATTEWTISSPVNCSTDITHNPPTPIADPCGPFSFPNITLAETDTIQLNSTAVATASSEINGSIIECIAGFVPSVSVGNISLCVIDELPAPVNLRCLEVPNGLSVSWDVVVDASSSCARSFIVYDVTVAGDSEANRTILSMNDAQVEITDLEPGQNYTISVRARLAQGTCETREAATVVCRTSDDLSPTTATPGDEGTSTVEPEVVNGNAVSAAAVAVPIVLILLAVAIVVMGVLIFVYYKRHDKKLPFNIPLPFRKFKDQNSETSSPSRPPTELKHTKAPSGDMYTVIDKIPAKSTNNEDQQDNSNDGLSDDSIDKSKDQDIPVNAVDGEADKPPPKPKRTNKTESKAKNKSKNEPSPQPALLPGAYEDIDDF